MNAGNTANSIAAHGGFFAIGLGVLALLRQRSADRREPSEQIWRTG